MNQKKDKDLLIGEAAKEFISKKKDVGLRESRIEEFYKIVKSFYVEGANYI